jgi:hypothetical protein
VGLYSISYLLTSPRTLERIKSRTAMIRFAAMLSANLNDEVAAKDSVARGLHLFEHVAHGLLAIGVFARFGRHLQKR